MFNECWYDDGALEHIGKLIKGIKCTGMYVEIGCWEGRSSTALANHIYPKPLICVDHFRGNEGEGPGHYTVGKAKERDVKATFQQNMKELTKGNWTLYDWDGDEFLQYAAGPIAFLHLDATHTYDSVMRTLALAGAKANPGALFCGDDYGGGVKQAVEEVFPKHQASGLLWWCYKD